jgi:hypothetical protein
MGEEQIHQHGFAAANIAMNVEAGGLPSFFSIEEPGEETTIASLPESPGKRFELACNGLLGRIARKFARIHLFLVNL